MKKYEWKDFNDISKEIRKYLNSMNIYDGFTIKVGYAIDYQEPSWWTNIKRHEIKAEVIFTDNTFSVVRCNSNIKRLIQSIKRQLRDHKNRNFI